MSKADKQEAKELQVHSKVGDLNYVQDDMDEVIQLLEQKLSTVLRPSEPEKEEVPSESNLVQLAEELGRTVQRAKTHRARLNSIIDRLEV